MVIALFIIVWLIARLVPAQKSYTERNVYDNNNKWYHIAQQLY